MREESVFLRNGNGDTEAECYVRDKEGRERREREIDSH
jgi:hypothetical protein